LPVYINRLVGKLLELIQRHKTNSSRLQT
jgi:hypothetical protein